MAKLKLLPKTQEEREKIICLVFCDSFCNLNKNTLTALTLGASCDDEVDGPSTGAALLRFVMGATTPTAATGGGNIELDEDDDDCIAACLK